MDEFCFIDNDIEHTQITDTESIIDIRLINIFDFLTGTLSKKFKAQVDCDLPRSVCTVNSTRVATMHDFVEMVDNKTFPQNMLMFSTQTVMAIPLLLLHKKYPREIITDGRGSLKARFTCDKDSWQVICTKCMYLNKFKEYLKMNVMFESQCDYVIITFEGLVLP
tara:strand:+ start:7484 stop:7978 length:495 start_codon:yes stop_codon:yes gene_type:complete